MNKGVNQILEQTAAGIAHNIRKETEPLIQKWEAFGMLDGIEKPHEKTNMARLLENQAKRLKWEANQTGTAANSEEWNGIALPLVRRVFGATVGKEFVSVQPMNLPSGKVFFLDYKYGSSQANFNTGKGKDSQEDSVYGVTNEEGQAREGLYGKSRYGYSINDYSSSALTTGSAIDESTVTTGSLTEALYTYDTELSASLVEANISFGASDSDVFVINVSTSSLSNPDMLGASAYEISGTGIISQYYDYTTTNANKSQITFVVSGSYDSLSDIVVKYHKQPTSATRGDFEETKTQENPLDIPEFNMEFRAEDIAAKTRKLKTKWTPEFQQDIEAYQAIDAEAELTLEMTNYISREIDLELVDMLRQDAKNKSYWSAQVGKRYDDATGTFNNFGTIQAEASAYTKRDWYNELLLTMDGISNEILQKTMLGGANFAIVPPKIATILSFAGGLDVSKKDIYSFNAGARYAGNFRNELDVYVLPYLTTNEIIMGFKGDSYLQHGAVYAPYIPLMSTPTIIDFENFSSHRMLMTRYAKKMLRGEFFGRILVSDLNEVYSS